MLFKRKSLIKKTSKIESSLLRFKKGQFSFASLNASQFLGILNDNIYKLLLIFFLLKTLGTEKAGLIISTVGALYVLPFLFFSDFAGVLADRFSKQRLIRWLKGAEVLITFLAFWAFYAKSPLACYALLILLATHSAFFGPSKYGIIPEIVERKSITKANSHMTSFTYLAMIIGTFLASFLTEITGENYVLSISFCFLFSILGLLSSFGIQKTAPQKTTKKPNLFFLKDIFLTIKDCRNTPFLAISLFGSAYFLFIGAFTQLNIIPFAIQSLHLSEYVGGYLFLITAVGIVLGSLIASRWLKEKLDLNVACILGGGLSLLFLLLWLFSRFLIPTCLFLVFIGLLGGMFVIAFDSFIQTNSPIQKRGQIIGSANFLSFFGVLVAALCLYLFNLFAFSAATGFFYISCLTLCAVVFLSIHLLETLFPFLAKNAFFYHKPSIVDPLKILDHAQLFLIQEWKWSLLWTVLIQNNRCRFLIQDPQKGLFFSLLCQAPCVYRLADGIQVEEALNQAKKLKEEGVSVCLYLSQALPSKKNINVFPFFLFKDDSCIIKEQEKTPGEKVILVEKLD